MLGLQVDGDRGGVRRRGDHERDQVERRRSRGGRGRRSRCTAGPPGPRRGRASRGIRGASAAIARIRPAVQRPGRRGHVLADPGDEHGHLVGDQPDVGVGSLSTARQAPWPAAVTKRNADSISTTVWRTGPAPKCRLAPWPGSGSRPPSPTGARRPPGPARWSTPISSPSAESTTACCAAGTRSTRSSSSQSRLVTGLVVCATYASLPESPVAGAGGAASVVPDSALSCRPRAVPACSADMRSRTSSGVRPPGAASPEPRRPNAAARSPVGLPVRCPPVGRPRAPAAAAARDCSAGPAAAARPRR